MTGRVRSRTLWSLAAVTSGCLATALVRFRLLRRLRVALGESGPRGVASRCLSKAADLTFDVRYGTDTARYVEAADLSEDAHAVPHAHDYVPTRAREFTALLRELHLPPGGTFVDIGAGKGRVMLLAAEYGFGRVIGVEFSPRLCAVARANIDVFRRRRRPTGGSISVVECDAAAFRIPDESDVLFMFNPFDAVVVRAVLENVADTLRRRPRKLWMIYNNPECQDIVDASGIFGKVGCFTYAAGEFQVYETVLEARGGC